MPSKQADEKWGISKIILYIFIPCVLGMILAAFIPQPMIGLIELREPIDNKSGRALTEQIQYAYNNKRIKAVVLIVDCPGGTVNDTELGFLELNRLREKKPVVAIVQGLSASGAYYVPMAADAILANPSAMIGNVGVIGHLPAVPMILEELYSTGPYKLWGQSRDSYVRQIEVMKEGFLEAVQFGRGDKLSLSPEEISRGDVYTANEALRLGLIDAIGSQSDAIDLAAKKAHIANYHTVRLDEELEQEKNSASSFYTLDENGEITGYPREPGFYYLYVPDVKGGLR